MASWPIPTFTSGIAFVHLPGVGSQPVQPGAVFGKLRLPTDPIGTTTVTFAGVNAGSEIRVYLPDGTEVAGIESCAANQALTWPVYAGGSPNNTVRITILLRGYRIQKFPYDVTLGNQTLPIFQIVDLGYYNPA